MINCYFIPCALLMLLGLFRLGVAESRRQIILGGIKKLSGKSLPCEGLRSMLKRDPRSSSDFVMAFAAITCSLTTYALGCAGLAPLLYLASDLIVEALERAVYFALGKLRAGMSALPCTCPSALLAYTNEPRSKC